MTFLQDIRRKRVWAAIIVFALSTFLAGESSWAQYGGGGGGGRGGKHSSDSDSDKKSSDTFVPQPPPVVLMPHGGEYLSTEKNYYEVVYMPLQTRIYLYDAKFKPLTAQALQAQMTVQFPTETTPRQVAFQFVAMPAGASEQDYLVAPIDVQPLKDKDVSISIQFSGLTNRSSPTASFTPHFANFKPRAYVVQASLLESDRDGIARQRLCPVTGAPLGSRGPVVKLYVAEYPLYVCGTDCIQAVKDNPLKFMPPH
jgi:hypothetical protein